MRNFTTTIALLSLTATALGSSQTDARLTPGQMEEDLFALSESLLQRHAGRLRYATEEELDLVFGDALVEASEERTVLEFYRSVARILSTVRCGHTRLQLARGLESEVLDAGGLMPFDVHLDGDRAWILHSYDPALEAGAEIGSINGRSIAEIRSRAFAMMAGDGFIESGKERNLARRFGRFYVLLIQEPSERGRAYEILLADAQKPVEVAGLTSAEYSERRVAPPQRPLIATAVFPEDKLGLLQVSQFGDRTGEASFTEQLESAFSVLNESGVENLAIDLRGNGGGTDDYGALLVSYMATRKFSYFERIEVTPEYDGPGGIVEKGDRRLVTAHRSLDPWMPAPKRFEGEIFLLEDGWTFSTAADVATVAHHNGFATLVGQESGGGYDGNTSGSSHRMALPTSGIRVNVPMWMYTTANVGHDHFARGAIPHHPVRPTIADALSGRDAELDLVRGLIQAR